MRIGITALGFAGGRPGSHEAHLPQLINAMVAADKEHQYVLFLRKDNRSCFPRESDQVVHIMFPAVCRRKPAQIMCEQMIVPVIALAYGVDLLHFPTNIRPMILPCQSVGTIHWVLTPLLAADFPFVKRHYFSALGKMSATKANRLIAVSEACKADMVQFLGVPADKIDVIHHGIRQDFGAWGDSPAMLGKYGLRQGYLLYVGTSAPYKNLETLIEAYAYARGKYALRSQLVMVGDIKCEWVMELALRKRSWAGDLSWTHDVVCAGYVPYEEMPRLYAGARVMVSVSLQETFGMVLLEAMAASVPLVVSSIPAHEEVAGACAVYVDPRNAVELAEAIWRVISSPCLRSQLVEEGLARVRRFSWEEAGKRTLEVYEKALGR